MNVNDLMTKNPHAITVQDTLAKARKLMEECRVRQLPVIDSDNRVVGIVTKKDIYSASISSLTQHIGKRQEILEQTIHVSEIMTADVLTISSDELVSTAASQIMENRIGALPVVDNGQLVGIISNSDVLAVAVQLLQERGC